MGQAMLKIHVYSLNKQIDTDKDSDKITLLRIKKEANMFLLMLAILPVKEIVVNGARFAVLGTTIEESLNNVKPQNGQYLIVHIAGKKDSLIEANGFPEIAKIYVVGKNGKRYEEDAEATTNGEAEGYICFNCQIVDTSWILGHIIFDVPKVDTFYLVIKGGKDSVSTLLKEKEYLCIQPDPPVNGDSIVVYYYPGFSYMPSKVDSVYGVMELRYTKVAYPVYRGPYYLKVVFPPRKYPDGETLKISLSTFEKRYYYSFATYTVDNGKIRDISFSIPDDTTLFRRINDNPFDIDALNHLYNRFALIDYNPDTLKSIARKELSVIDSVGEINDTVRYVKILSLLQMGEIDSALSAFETFQKKYGSIFNLTLMRLYSHIFKTNQRKPEYYDKLKSIFKEGFLSNPEKFDSPQFTSEIRFLINNPAIPDKPFKKLFRVWRKRRYDPEYTYVHAYYLIKRKKNYKGALKEIDRMIEQIMEHPYFYYRGGLYPLSSLLGLRAWCCEKLHDKTGAFYSYSLLLGLHEDANMNSSRVMFANYLVKNGYPLMAEKHLVDAVRGGASWAKENLKHYYILLHGSDKGFDHYISEKVNLNQVKPAPNFTGKTIDGKPFKLSDYLGKKVIVLNFWGLGCSPCIAEIPTISKLVVKYPDVLFVAITGSINEGVKRLVRDKGFKYLQVESQNAFKKYGVVSIPRHFVIDRNKRIVFQWTGSISENSINLMEEAIEEYR